MSIQRQILMSMSRREMLAITALGTVGLLGSELPIVQAAVDLDSLPRFDGSAYIIPIEAGGDISARGRPEGFFGEGAYITGVDVSEKSKEFYLHFIRVVGKMAELRRLRDAVQEPSIRPRYRCYTADRCLEGLVSLEGFGSVMQSHDMAIIQNVRGKVDVISDRQISWVSRLRPDVGGEMTWQPVLWPAIKKGDIFTARIITSSDQELGLAISDARHVDVARGCLTVGYVRPNSENIARVREGKHAWTSPSSTTT